MALWLSDVTHGRRRFARVSEVEKRLRFWGVDGFSSAREQLLQGDYRRWIGVWAPEELQLGVECGGGLVRLRGKAQATPAAGKLDLKLQQA